MYDIILTEQQLFPETYLKPYFLSSLPEYAVKPLALAMGI